MRRISVVPGASMVSGAFSSLSAWRQARVFHPSGLRLGGTLHVSADGPLGDSGDRLSVSVRFSKAAGTPGGTPDILGVALRADGVSGRWDLTFASAARGTLGRMLLRPVRSWGGTTYSSLAPYRTSDGFNWLLATIDNPIPDDSPRLEPLRAVIERDHRLQVSLHSTGATGDARPLAHIELNRIDVDTDAAESSFDPMTYPPPAARLYPQWLTTVRELAYRGSRAGRDRSTAR